MRNTPAFVLSLALSFLLSLGLPTSGFSQEADVPSATAASEAVSESRGGFFSGIGEALGRVAAAPVKAARDLADGAQRGWSSDRSASSQQSTSTQAADPQSTTPQSVSTALASAMALAKAEQSTLLANAVPSQGAARTSQDEFAHTRGASERPSSALSGRKARTTGSSGSSGANGAAALSGKQGASASFVLVNGYREQAALSQVPPHAAAATTSQSSAQASSGSSASSVFDRAVASVREAAIGKQAPAVIEDLSFRASKL